MTQITATPTRIRDLAIEPMNLDRDWPEIDRLLGAEDWPFVREDFEASHEQPHAVGFIANHANHTNQRDSLALAGFFVAHHFGDIGYFDMMVVDQAVRKSKLATKLAFETNRALIAKGMQGFVAHSTNDSFDVFRFFGYERSLDFTLMRREPVDRPSAPASLEPITLESSDLDELIALDAAVFGLHRTTWFSTLQEQPTTQFVGVRQAGRLVASACLRKRRDHALCLDSVNAESFIHLDALLTQVIHALPGHRLECFARTGSDLHRWLQNQGWFVPDFFASIGPLVEWRKGRTHAIGKSPLIRSLNWF